MYNVSSDVKVKEIIPNRKISIEWDIWQQRLTFDLWLYQIETTLWLQKKDFSQAGMKLIEVEQHRWLSRPKLDGLKAYLEFGIETEFKRYLSHKTKNKEAKTNSKLAKSMGSSPTFYFVSVHDP